MAEYDFSEAFDSLIEVVAFAALQPYLQLVRQGILTLEQAAGAAREDATTYETMKLRAPLVGEAVAAKLRAYADRFDREGPPELTIIDGGSDPQRDA
jgi:hypothetical protein